MVRQGWVVHQRISALCGVILLLIIVTSCTPVPNLSDTDQQGVGSKWDERTLGEGYAELSMWTPYPYGTPLPPNDPTPIDGFYVRSEEVYGKWAPCRRCPPYPPYGGEWILWMQEGIYRIYHPGTGWRSLGSFTVNAQHVTLYNDPFCYRAVGRYVWQRVDNSLRLVVEEDDCYQNRRTDTLSRQAWTGCDREILEKEIVYSCP